MIQKDFLKRMPTGSTDCRPKIQAENLKVGYMIKPFLRCQLKVPLKQLYDDIVRKKGFGEGNSVKMY